MRLLSNTPPPLPGAAGPNVILAPGDRFFMRRIELPPGTAAADVPGFVALQLEELAPFPLDQLSHGHVRAGDGSAVFAYAAYRRRFPPEQADAWRRAMLVLPDFLPALRLRFPRETLVTLRSEAALAVLLFDAEAELPARAASRPLPADASPDALAELRQRLIAQVGGPRSAHEVSLRSEPPRLRGKSLEWVLAPEGIGTAVEVTTPIAECWAMDIRDPEFVARQRKRLGFDVILWRIVQGAAAVIALLLLGELLLLAAGGYERWLAAQVSGRELEVAALEKKDTVVTRLSEYGRSAVRPFDMFEVVGSLRPKGKGIFFTRATAEGATRFLFDASVPDVAAINTYETALRAAPQIASVEVRNINTRPDGTTFSMTLEFHRDAFAPAQTVAVPRP